MFWILKFEFCSDPIGSRFEASLTQGSTDRNRTGLGSEFFWEVKDQIFLWIILDRDQILSNIFGPAQTI